MLIVKVKICGITNFDDAKAAIDMGADLLGFILYPPSPRYIEPEKAAEIICKLPGFIDTVGVFVNPSIEHIQSVIADGCLSWVQLHGDETPEFVESLQHFDVKTMKALRIKEADDIKKAETFFTDTILLDAYHPEQYGGTGQRFDWNILGHINKRVFLSGGITPENAREAIELGVYGIDVSSGIESEPGRKDHEKMQVLFDNIHDLRG